MMAPSDTLDEISSESKFERLFAPILGPIDRWLMHRRQMSHWRNDRPERIILVRHGESLGNAAREIYSKTPDSQIELTDRGFAQSVTAGLKIRKLIGNETARFFHGPYLRTRQTLVSILKAFDGQPVEVNSEPRLREQDFGIFQSPETMDAVMQERQQFGRFYYRFANGEAGTDVYDRMSTFITDLFRTMGTMGYYYDGDSTGRKRFQRKSSSASPQNYVLVTPGLLMRIFCMCYLRWTVSEFEEVWNPSNGEIWVLQKVPGQGTYELLGRWKASKQGSGELVDLRFGKNRTEPMPVHMKRPTLFRKLTAGTTLEGDELKHLRDVPGPRRWSPGDWKTWKAEDWGPEARKGLR